MNDTTGQIVFSGRYLNKLLLIDVTSCGFHWFCYSPMRKGRVRIVRRSVLIRVLADPNKRLIKSTMILSGRNVRDGPGTVSKEQVRKSKPPDART